MGSAVYLAIAARAAQRDRNDRLAFLQSSAACQDTPCDCPLCSTQPSTKPAYHVTAYMIVGLLLPWCESSSLLSDPSLFACMRVACAEAWGQSSVV